MNNRSLESPYPELLNELLQDCLSSACASLHNARDRKFAKMRHLWSQFLLKWRQNRKMCPNQSLQNPSKMLILKFGDFLTKTVVPGCPLIWYPPKHVFCPPPRTIWANWANFITERGLNWGNMCIKFHCDWTRLRHSWTVPKVLAPTRMAPWPWLSAKCEGQIRIELVEFYKGVGLPSAYRGWFGRCGVPKNCAYRLTGDFNTDAQPIYSRKFLKKRSL